MSKTKVWSQYEAGREYKRRIGLYETVRRNEDYYRGDQWKAQGQAPLPQPVFNGVRRITDYLVGAVASGRISMTYSDEGLLPMPNEQLQVTQRQALEMLNRHMAYRWENCRMDRLIYRLLHDAAITGDGVLYCYRSVSDGSSQHGWEDIRTVTWDSCELYAADMNLADIQAQEYLILAGRESVAKLKREAKEQGLDRRETDKIRSDAAMAELGAHRYPELEDEEQAKATVLLKFWREDGVVWFEKATQQVVLKRGCTGLRLYPVAYFNWMPSRGSFHGTSPISGIIANQKFINRAYAMAMKHMTDAAFSKVIYDKSRIPEWSNELGEAIAAVGGNLSDAVQVIGTGEMQSGYLELIESVISMTKEMAGATDPVLGSGQANNTSAILALQEASRTTLRHVSTAYQQCLEDLADIWADMLCSVSEGEQLLPYLEEGERRLGKVDFALLRQGLLHARVEIGNLTQYSASGTQNTLDTLLAGGHITLRQYLEQLPTGILPMREQLMRQLEDEGKGGEEYAGSGDDSDDTDTPGV